MALARVMQNVQAGVELGLEPANGRFAPKAIVPQPLVFASR
jgi:hypothetical protein